jgi:hypothetical protein
MEQKHVLIVENSSYSLKPILEQSIDKKDYRMSGIFTEFDKLNRNDRIYTAEKFIPHLNEMLERKNSLGVIYGEFDHPDVFDTSLSRVSHTIEKVYFNKNENRVEGEIRLLNTHWGKEAKALVDDGLPLFVSSRAAGVTESDGTVTIKKLFTYDAVADPGFGSARMSLNESLGFNEKKSNFRIYDLSDESKINELFTMNNNDFVTKTQMEEYSGYITEEMSKIKQTLESNAKSGNIDPNEILKMSEVYERLNEQQTKIINYLNYISSNIQIVVNENEQLKETTEKLKEHNNYLAEKLDKNIQFSDYLAEQLDKSISYVEYIGETLDKNIEFSEYIAEHVDKNIQFSDYLAENIEKNIEYSEYIAENLDNNIAYGEYIAENLDNNIAYAEYIAENLDNNIAYGEYIAETLDNNIKYSEYIAENLDNNIAYAEYIAENLDNNISYSEYIAENVSDSQAYLKYIAEGLDNTIENIKLNKMFENIDGAQNFNMRNIDDVEKYYDDDDDFVVKPQAQNPIENPQVQTQIQVENPVEQPVGTQVQPEQPIETQPEIKEEPISAQGEELNLIKSGDIVSLDINGETKTGEVLSSDAEILVVKLSDTEELVEVQESKVTFIGNFIFENEKSLTKHMADLITEVKKRKASEESEPNFLQFLTEQNRKHWYNLIPEDKEKVIFAINESNTPIYSEIQLLNAIQNALSVKKTFDDILIENMPSDLEPVWKKLNENTKNGILSSAKLYQTLKTPAQMENFWRSRNLDNYISLNETKQVLNENRFVDSSQLTDEQVEMFMNKIRSI